MQRPEATLFMLMSVDGKISTGDDDALDFDKDLQVIHDVKEGLGQYYELEQQTDKVSLNTGRVMAKIGINDRTDEPNKIDVDFVILDDKPYLQEQGIRYLSKWVRKLFLVTANNNHPAITLAKLFNNIDIIKYDTKVNLADLFNRLKSIYSINKITIQSGGTLNASLIRIGLIDHLSIVVVPVIIGGKDTATLVDGESLHSSKELDKLCPLRLIGVKSLENSYLHLKYDVIN